MTWCWLFHRWGLWEPYTTKRREPAFVLESEPWKQGMFTTTTITGTQRRVTITEHRERRRCTRCGAAQDRKVGAGGA